MRIFLVGMMGSGKSTVGKKLAESLLVDFHDLDKIIEAKLKKNIKDNNGRRFSMPDRRKGYIQKESCILVEKNLDS